MNRSMNQRLRWAALAAAVLAASSCGVRAPGSAGSGSSSGPISAASSAPAGGQSSSRAAPTKPAGPAGNVVGVVRTGPGCPMDPVYHVCGSHPLSRVQVQALTPNAKVAASAWTQYDGRYSLRLAPGSYVLVVLIAAPYPRCPRHLVSVGPGAVARADITCRSGIRVPGPPATNPA